MVCLLFDMFSCIHRKLLHGIQTNIDILCGRILPLYMISYLHMVLLHCLLTYADVWQTGRRVSTVTLRCGCRLMPAREAVTAFSVSLSLSVQGPS